MKLDIFSHCVIDHIHIDNSIFTVPGGPACYCSFTARALKFDVKLHTKYGSDFPLADNLTQNKISINNGPTEKLTTQFTLKIHDSERILFLENLCDSIDYDELISDNVLVSPVFDEISSDLLEKLKSISGFIFLDPQGFLRRKGINNKIYLESTDLNLSKISAIKTSPDELNALTGISTIDGMNVLQKKGIEYVILTDKQNISLLFDGKIYSIKLPNIELYDTTGIGDIFSTTFCCTIIKEKDFLWALSFAAGSAQAALENKKIGLDKIPSRGAIETNATYFYNTVKFREI